MHVHLLVARRESVVRTYRKRTTVAHRLPDDIQADSQLGKSLSVNNDLQPVDSDHGFQLCIMGINTRKVKILFDVVKRIRSLYILMSLSQLCKRVSQLWPGAPSVDRWGLTVSTTMAQSLAVHCHCLTNQSDSARST